MYCKPHAGKWGLCEKWVGQQEENSKLHVVKMHAFEDQIYIY